MNANGPCRVHLNFFVVADNLKLVSYKTLLKKYMHKEIIHIFTYNTYIIIHIYIYFFIIQYMIIVSGTLATYGQFYTMDQCGVSLTLYKVVRISAVILLTMEVSCIRCIRNPDYYYNQTLSVTLN